MELTHAPANWHLWLAQAASWHPIGGRRSSHFRPVLPPKCIPMGEMATDIEYKIDRTNDNRPQPTDRMWAWFTGNHRGLLSSVKRVQSFLRSAHGVTYVCYWDRSWTLRLEVVHLRQNILILRLYDCP